MPNIINLTRLVKKALLTKDPAKRVEHRWELAANIAEKLGGFRLYKYSHSWYKDPEFKAVWKSFPEGSGRPKDKRFALYQLARSVAAVPGDTAECGSWRGAGSYLICKATQPGRTHHVFDSFEGVSKPTEGDATADAEAYKWQGGEYATPEGAVRKNLEGFDVRLYKGWIPERFPEVADRRFALVHIDVDVYRPTLDSLEFFYERVTSGGLIVCDDYGFIDCPGAKKAMDEFFRDKPERYVVHLTSGQGLVVKR